MTLTERTEIDKIEIVGRFKLIQVRISNCIDKDGIEISKSYMRYVLDPGKLDEFDNLIETNIENEDQQIKNICNTVWTDEIKEMWRNELISQKNYLNTSLQ